LCFPAFEAEVSCPRRGLFDCGFLHLAEGVRQQLDRWMTVLTAISARP